MKERFEEHICQNFNLKDKRILVAISGGVDSMVLATLFYQLNYDIVLAHCNFQLRGEESDQDEVFVRNFGENLAVKTIVKRFDTSQFSAESKLNTQLSARKLRYDWFYEIASENQCDYIATAHHADDNLETFIINLSRGSGLDGLLGIPQKNGKIIRPMLLFSREEILEFAKQNSIHWREDSSNQTEKYVRNKIRHTIIPVLKEIHPTFLENFKETQHYLSQSSQFIEENIQKIKEQCFEEREYQTIIRLEPLRNVSDIDFVLHKLFYPYNFRNIPDLKKMLYAESGKQLFSPTHNLISSRDYLVLMKTSPKNKELEDEGIIFLVSENHFDRKDTIKLSISDMRSYLSLEMTILKRDINHFFDLEQLKNENNEVAYFDYDTLQFPLMFRHKKEGDFFYPIGMQQKKKLSKFYIDEKYSLFDKDQQWLLCSQENIAWVIGKRMDNRFKVTNKTQRILKVSIL
ncbi:tRNA lysidine(34) synthetase TilS [Capnocytophaga cynodegmi]|uniref:tRNA lysidine(34) synthetase TilS n=1 Tax=Capnocytophaga cynodegmi TaxID=28189 RepID=UPI00035F6D0D|nr:tRNA lysidine(34) synthetase TilS [Capnocytophaga cynodegmi]CEN36667.1 tRNA(Ile)-lysidine synthase [Capnocytophaga cynodegmi]